MNATPVDVGQQDLLFRQYKLAVEMAAGISARRQAANKFYISLLSGFGAFYSLLEKASFPFTGSAWRYVLPILPVCWCVVWRRTIQSHRRINIAKWKAIEELEAKLPGKPFSSEGKNLGEGGSFALTKIEAVIPVLVGFVFLLLASLPPLELLFAHLIKR